MCDCNDSIDTLLHDKINWNMITNMPHDYNYWTQSKGVTIGAEQFHFNHIKPNANISGKHLFAKIKF